MSDTTQSNRVKTIGQSHYPSLDDMTPAQIRVVCELLLYVANIEQRLKFRDTFTWLYQMVYTD